MDTDDAALLELRERLDGAKTAEERNRLGQFATPLPLARAMFAFAHQHMASEPIRFLDPAFGTGSFYAALRTTFPASQIAWARGYEIDPHYGAPAQQFWSSSAVEIHLADFTRLPPPLHNAERANLLICNPPYVRHHHLGTADKQRLRADTNDRIGMRLSGLAGLYCYFLGLAHDWLAEEGLAGWLIPSEFMDVNYGAPIKDYLLRHVTVLAIQRFDPQDMQFADALVSSAIVWFRKRTPPHNHTVRFVFGGAQGTAPITHTLPAHTLQQSTKWTHYARIAAPAAAPSPESVRLSDLFMIKRGLATGANGFFILTAAQATQHQIPADVLTPILPSPRAIHSDVIEADGVGLPLGIPQLFLLNCSLLEHEILQRYPALWDYLQHGIAQGIPAGYLCSRRSPWYLQEQRPPAPLLCPYMGRATGARAAPFRFILNHSQATAPNIYLLLYPRPPLATALHDRPALLEALWRTLNTIQPGALLDEGRVYGGGLHKLEPRELGNTPIPQVLELLPDTLHNALAPRIRASAQAPARLREQATPPTAEQTNY